MSFRIVPLVKGSAPAIALYRPSSGPAGTDCMPIDSSKVSRRHSLYYGQYTITSTGDSGKSQRWCVLNGRLLEESRLQPGDELHQFGSCFAWSTRTNAAGLGRPSGRLRDASPVATPAERTTPGLVLASTPDIDLVPIDDI